MLAHRRLVGVEQVAAVVESAVALVALAEEEEELFRAMVVRQRHSQRLLSWSLRRPAIASSEGVGRF